MQKVWRNDLQEEAMTQPDFQKEAEAVCHELYARYVIGAWQLGSGSECVIAALTAAYQRGIEDAANSRKSILIADYGQEFDHGRDGALDVYETAIRNLAKPSGE